MPPTETPELPEPVNVVLVGVVSSLLGASAGMFFAVFIIWIGSTEPRFTISGSKTFGEAFAKFADDEDAIADEWEMKLYGDGWSGFAGWDCGRQSTASLYRELPLAIIRGHREAARMIRRQLPHSKEYVPLKWEDYERDQAEWQKWYDEFHKCKGLVPLEQRIQSAQQKEGE